MTKIYCYCLFDGQGRFQGVYSSVAAVHRDAMKICNQGSAPVVMELNGEAIAPSVTMLRNTFKGAFEVQVAYRSGLRHRAIIIKTKLKE